MKHNLLTLAFGALGGAVIVLAAQFLMTDNSLTNDLAVTEGKPLYWVAPMDDKYRKNEPGLSPMGMALVPVYANKSSGGVDEEPGVITISPSVVNNLGVRTAIVESKALNVNIKTVGYVTYNEDTLVHIHPRIEGWVEKLHVKAAGDPVKKGQPLYDIYSPALVNAQEELVMAIGRKNSRLIQAAEDRLKSLQFPDRAIKKLKRSKKIQQRVSFYAPQSGVIDNLHIRQGFFVKPGTMLMSIGSLDEMWVEAEVFERQAGQVKMNEEVSMTLDYLPGKTWAGNVDYIYPTLDAITRTVKIRLRFDNKDRLLKPNMFAQVVIHAQGDEETLIVPKEAIIRSGSRDRVVLALGEGRFKSIDVSVGRYDDINAEILGGLNEGEKIVSSAQFLLDSESSKNSDFKRLESVPEGMSETSGKNDVSKDHRVSSTTTQGVINSISNNTLNITRDAIEKWNRPIATLDFNLGEGVDVSPYKEKQSITFTFEIHQGDFIITDISPVKIIDMNGMSKKIMIKDKTL
jgi:Cu(I)/Ag(I) efflux system membrane fusion protein